MSNTMPPAASVSRPGTVTAASYLLYLTAIVQVLGAVLNLSTIGAQREAMRVAYADYPDLVDTVPTVATISVVVAAAISVLLAAGFVVLGILDGKGKNVARIITWVLGGVAVCCVGGSLALSATGSMLGGQGMANAPDPAEVQRIVNEHLPSWYNGVSVALGVIGLIALLLAMILLALPASNAYFRRPPQPQAEVPPYPTYPAGSA